MLVDQTEANYLSGRIQAVENRVLLEIELEFSGLYREVFSPADQQWTDTGTSLASSLLANVRGSTDLENIKLVPRQVIKNPPVNGYAPPRVIFEVEAPEGLAGRTIILPDIDPLYIAPDVDTTPGLVDAPVPLNILVTGDDTNGVEIYKNATWAARNTGLTGDALKVRALKVSPFWWLLQNSSDPEKAILWIATDNSIRYSNTFGKTWADRTPVSALASAPGGVTTITVDYVAVDLPALGTDINRIVVAQCREEVAGTWHGWNLISTNGGYNWTNAKVAVSGNETKMLGLRIDQTVGTQLYEARQDITASLLYVRQLDTSLALVGSEESFAAATEAEINARTYKLAVYTCNDPSQASNKDRVIAYGRMQKT